jgi:alkyl hydroperoxide reductase subunit AhpC
MYLDKDFPVAALQAVNENNEMVSVDFSLMNSWKVVYFYPKDFTFVCPTEIVDFDNHVEDFRKLGAEVFGVSPDNEFCHLAWKDSHPDLKNLKHTLVADSGNKLSGQLGILHEQDGVPYRVTFIVDPNNKIKYAALNGINVGRNAKEVLRVLDSTQQGDYGLLCGANREVGGDTI